MKSGLVLALAMGAPSILLAAGDAAKGKTLYTSKCGACHGSGGEAKEAIAKAMQVEMRHLGAKEVQDKPDAKLLEEITKGVGKMKPVAGLKEAEAADILAFVRSLKK
jgi:mono/diheme cytochrome c family protein